MTNKSTHYKKVLKFWRAIEIFTLPDVPGTKQLKGKYCTDLKRGDPLPWDDEEFAYPEEGKRWKHTLYFYCIPKQSIIGLLDGLSPDYPEDYREAQTGDTCYSAIVLDQHGRPAERTYIRSAFLYGMKILAENRNLDDVAELVKKAQTDYIQRFQANTEEEGSSLAPVTWTELEKEFDDLEQFTDKWPTLTSYIKCVSEQIFENAATDAPFLNSFYLNDLNTLINHPEKIGTPLELFLTQHEDIKARHSLLTPQTLLDYIDPMDQSPGRWPANPAFGLYSAQQAALALTFTHLRQATGMIGINGPPGTGKTTLLREILADIIVTRAKRLLNADITKLFSGKRNNLAEYIDYYDIDHGVFGNDGILVASNNNAAVENISKELPSYKSIDKESFEDADYFSPIAQNLNEKEPCWGLISAVLGNSANRNAFISKFWYDKKNGFNAFLQSQYTGPDQARQHASHFKLVTDELRTLLREFDIFQDTVSEHYKALLKGNEIKLEKLASTLLNEYHIHASDLPGKDFLALTMEDIHKLTPYSSQRINMLRSEIFLKCLELHKAAILVNAKYFRANLNAFMNMLQGKHSVFFDGKITATLWSSFYFCIPVVSTTLASIDRVFPRMGRGSIGWLMLDEAGQATPQSACGAIWRSQRSIIIGDTLQIPPVVTIPKGLGKLLQTKYGIKDDCWSPLIHSAQFLADRITPIGAQIDIANGQVWTGVPLRAHRRCHEPMFSISNTIAYNGQMVKVTPDTDMDTSLLKSCWIDVKGLEIAKSHIVAEEIKALEQMLALLPSTQYDKEIFIISPFRLVSEYFRNFFAHRKGMRLRFGTIHTFQGKEADIVFLILGTDPGGRGAREWASLIPNILNVAVTRARKRLFVIGNRQLWKTCNYFDHLAKELPVNPFKSGDLFQDL